MVKGRGSPTVPVIGMLKYCSDTVRGQEQGGCGAHRKRACSSPALWDKARRWWRWRWWWGVEDGEGSSASPTRHVSQPEEQWHASPQSPAPARFHQTPLRMWLSILGRVYCFVLQCANMCTAYNLAAENFLPPLSDNESKKKKKRKKTACNGVTQVLRKLKVFAFFCETFCSACTADWKEGGIHMQYFDYANLEGGGGVWKKSWSCSSTERTVNQIQGSLKVKRKT